MNQEKKMRDFSVRAKIFEGGEIKFRLYDWDTETYFTQEMTKEELRVYLIKHVDSLIDNATTSGEAYFWG